MNKQATKIQESRRTQKDYALRRSLMAIDRVIASETKEQRKKAVAWASLWHKHWKSLSPNTK